MTKDKKPIDWSDIERDYRESPRSLRELAEWHGVAESSIRYRAKKRGWPRALCADAGTAQAAQNACNEARATMPATAFVREPTTLTAENTDPDVIVARGRNLIIRMLDELDAATAYLGEVEAAIMQQIGGDDDGRRREIAARAVSLRARADTVKALAVATKTLAESTVAAGKKAARQASATESASAGIYAVPTRERRMQ